MFSRKSESALSTNRNRALTFPILQKIAKLSSADATFAGAKGQTPTWEWTLARARRAREETTPPPHRHDAHDAPRAIVSACSGSLELRVRPRPHPSSGHENRGISHGPCDVFARHGRAGRDDGG